MSEFKSIDFNYIKQQVKAQIEQDLNDVNQIELPTFKLIEGFDP
jgi:hypothetical protein